MPSAVAGLSPAPPPAPPLDRKEVIDKLALYVARHGPDFEELTRSRNEGNPKFGFLSEAAAPEIRLEREYYLWTLEQERKKVAAASGKAPIPVLLASTSPSAAPPWRKQQLSTVVAPFSEPTGGAASPLPDPTYGVGPTTSAEVVAPRSLSKKRHFDETGGHKRFNEDQPSRSSSSSSSSRPLLSIHAEADYEDLRAMQQQPQHSKPGHHIGDFLPKEELDKFLPKKPAPPTPVPAPQSADLDVGKKLLQKMGWKEGTGLGSTGEGITEPIKAEMKNDLLGVGISDPATASEKDDIYEAYKKRMMKAYRYRPNPLNNPRRQYY